MDSGSEVERYLARQSKKGVRQDDFKIDTSQEDEDEPGFFEKFKGLRDKLKLGPHHKMERFTIVAGASIAFLLLFAVMSFASHRSDVANLESSQASFTEAFDFSLSGQTGTVEGVYGDENNTDVMVLFSFDDPTAMSNNADNYELFITKQNRGSMNEETAPNVQMGIFGSTGHGVIRFSSKTGEPIKSELLNVVIRANTTLASGGGGAMETDGVVDESFDNFDQATLVINPGAVNVDVLDNIKPGEEDPRRLYTALVAEAEAEAVHEEIEATTSELATLLNRSEEYTGRLTSGGFIPPKTPSFIEGDKINDDGVLVSNNTVVQGHEFNYWSKSIWDGYLNQVINDFSQYEEYMHRHSDDYDNEEVANARAEMEDVQDPMMLKKEDGSEVILDNVETGTSSSTNVAAKEAVESLTATWREYLINKQALQQTHMGDLLVIDAEIQAQNGAYSTATNKVTWY